MIAVIFEVVPAEGQRNIYLDLAADLRKQLEVVDGFISIERFQSLSDPQKLLSLSFWRDEQAIAVWRRTHEHRLAQSHGRNGVLAHYRLRVAPVVRDYGLNDRAQVPHE